MSLIILFIHLKIIYYNIFQFSISHTNRRLVLPNLKTIWWIFGQDLVGPILTSLAHNTPSLFYRVYKGYFPNCSFMDAELGSNPSYIWRSLLAARDFIIEGSKWKVGDGRSIGVVTHKWLSHKPIFLGNSNLA